MPFAKSKLLILRPIVDFEPESILPFRNPDEEIVPEFDHPLFRYRIPNEEEGPGAWGPYEWRKLKPILT